MTNADALPQYLRLKQHVQARIAAGDWAPGARIPSEGELVREFGLSRMTVNRALRELAQAGAINRVQGLGSFVAQPKVESTLVEVRSIRDDITARGQSHQAQLLAHESVAADAPLADALGVTKGQFVFHTRMLHSASQQPGDDHAALPLQLETRWVNPLAAPGYGAQVFSAEHTPHHYLSQVAPLTRAEHVIEAEAASSEIAEALQLKLHEPVLTLLRRTWSGDQIVTVARLFHPAGRYRFSGQFRS